MRCVFLSCTVVFALMILACGGKSKSNPECIASGIACTEHSECCTGNCDETANVCSQVPGECTANGEACQLGLECCSFSCGVDGSCSDGQCTDDGAACGADEECCSGTCEGDVCKPLSAECKTSGNSCAGDTECCSKYCNDGMCDAQPSYCRQVDDICTADFECCAGFCQKAEGSQVGTCQLVPASGAGSCLSAGEVCGGIYNGEELPTCGGECCSRACLPYGPTGVLICQPPSGCRPTGEVCANDSDCCGSAENPDGDKSDVRCSKVDGNPLGRCDAGNSCTPAGGICRLQSQSCNENANCCSGNVLQFDTCKLDSLGIPRCVIAEMDCTNPEDYVGEDCATSADCCGLPCTPSGSGEFPPLKCGTACVEDGATCTTNADCCATLTCEVEPGSTSGTCVTGNNDCAEYGQACTGPADCCNDIPCTDGVCRSIVID